MKYFLTAFFVTLIALSGTIAAAQPISLSGEGGKSNRHVYLYGQINDQNAAMVVNQIRSFSEVSDEEIVLHLVASPGGSVYSGLYILDAMKESSAPIHTVCESYCMSMAATLLSVGEVREASVNTTIMFHEVSMTIGGKISDVANDYGEGRRLENIILMAIRARSGLTIETLVEMQSRDHYMSSADALKLGLIDVITAQAEK